jgi:DNA-binding CsgD family transcriptional regulator
MRSASSTWLVITTSPWSGARADGRWSSGGHRRRPTTPTTRTCLERDVLRLAATGTSNPDVAQRPSIGVRTVESYSASLMHKQAPQPDGPRPLCASGAGYTRWARKGSTGTLSVPIRTHTRTDIRPGGGLQYDLTMARRSTRPTVDLDERARDRPRHLLRVVIRRRTHSVAQHRVPRGPRKPDAPPMRGPRHPSAGLQPPVPHAGVESPGRRSLTRRRRAHHRRGRSGALATPDPPR